MSLLQDPFYVVKEEVQQSVNGVTTLYERWQELLKNSNTAQNDEFKWTTNQLKTGVRSIEWDLADLEETIGIVESNRQRFKLDQAEVESRKKFITETKGSIKKMKDDLQNATTKGKMEHDNRDTLMRKKTQDVPDRFSGLDNAIQQDNDNFITGHHQRQEQLINQQDDDLDALSHTVATLGNMGEAINSELVQQARILEDMEGEVDKTSGRLSNVVKKVNRLLESTSDRVQWCIIISLLLILVGLVIVVFYV